MAKYPVQHEQSSEAIHVTRDEVTAIVREQLQPVGDDVREIKAALLGDLNTPDRGVLPRLAKIEAAGRVAKRAMWVAITSLMTIIGAIVAKLV